MSTDDTSRTMRHILIALDSAQDPGALELAAQLAALVQGTLQGVFVEDADLLRIAQLPFAHEVSRNSAMTRRLDTAQLERDLRAQAEEVRRMLENHALRHSVDWSFRIERGALTATLAASGETDIVILGRSGIVARNQSGEATPVLAAFDGSAAASRALDTAADMSSAGDLLVLLPAAHATELRPAAATQLAAQDRRAHYLVLPDLSPPQLIAAGRRHHCRLLVVGGPPSTLLPLLPLLQHSNCPVAIVP